MFTWVGHATRSFPHKRSKYIRRLDDWVIFFCHLLSLGNIPLSSRTNIFCTMYIEKKVMPKEMC
jgi:hypothetical protein